MGKCLFLGGEGEVWSGGTGNRSDLEHKKCIISSFLVFENGFFLLELSVSSALCIDIRGSESFGRC